MHVVAALGRITNHDDELHIEARRRQRQQSEPFLIPSPRISKVERHFGELLKLSGFDPIPQLSVAQYYLDFAIVGEVEGIPIRLDIEVDGRHWHEELPGRRRPHDDRRDQVLKSLGWRPIRFWADEIESDATGCVNRIQDEVRSPNPLSRTNIR